MGGPWGPPGRGGPRGGPGGGGGYCPNLLKKKQSSQNAERAKARIKSNALLGRNLSVRAGHRGHAGHAVGRGVEARTGHATGAGLAGVADGATASSRLGVAGGGTVVHRSSRHAVGRDAGDTSGLLQTFQVVSARKDGARCGKSQGKKREGRTSC